eukprot:TRINITY_DN4494_c0_g1_i3.p2 TRINITY_DN4494_c0_g1~~TRINITY_DN4494_c0_g1_i3.p2  ORF type:complete len:630 (-),score=108.48 TRINITY_DN4494_c0_g1_i3:18-1907(-)
MAAGGGGAGGVTTLGVVVLVQLLMITQHAHLARGCGLSVEQSAVVGYADLMSFPGVWNGKASTVVAVDPDLGDFVLYPQMLTGAHFETTLAGQGSQGYDVTGREDEVFVAFDRDGKHKWTGRGYASTVPVLADGDVYLLFEPHVTKLRRDTGAVEWKAPLCSTYNHSVGAKAVNDIFPVVNELASGNGDAGELAVGLLMSGAGLSRGMCGVNVQGKGGTVTATNRGTAEEHTPFVFFLSKQSGAVIRYEEFPPIRPDLLSLFVLESDGTATAVGISTGDPSKAETDIVRFTKPLETAATTGEGSMGSRRVQFTYTVVADHPHNYEWSKAFADDENDHFLFATDPVGRVTMNGEVADHTGLVFGGVNRNGTLAWRRAVEYAGVATASVIAYADVDLVVVGGIWDGVGSLVFDGSVALGPVQRPVQGMLGFLAVYHVPSGTFLSVVEVAPEVVYPGHNVAFWGGPLFSKTAATEGNGNGKGNGKGSAKQFRVISSPTFWDSAPTRRIDSRNTVTVAQPEKDAVVLVRWVYDPCPVPHLRRSRYGHGKGSFGAFLAVLFISFLVGVAGVVLYNFLRRQGYMLPPCPDPRRVLGRIPFLAAFVGGSAAAGYTAAATTDSVFDDDFDLENDPLA